MLFFILKLSGFILLILSFSSSFADDCEVSARQYASGYVDLLRQPENEDALARLLFQWEQDCGMSEPVFRARALQLIAAGRFPGMLDEKNMLDHAIAFEVRHRIIESIDDHNVRDDYFAEHKEYFGFVPLDGEFDRHLLRWASQLKSNEPGGSLAYLFLELYSGNPSAFFSALKNERFHQTNLGEEYRNRVNQLLALPEFNMAVSAGLWLPLSDLTKIGAHPALGVMLGIKKGKYNVNGVFEFRFGKSSNPISITLRDTLVETRNFQGAYGGIEAGRKVWSNQVYAVSMVAGLGYDMMELVEEGGERQRQSFFSPAVYLGSALEYTFANRSWMKFKPGYYFLNHKQHPGSSLAGNAWGFRLVYGFSENARKSQNLKRLGYENW